LASFDTIPTGYRFQPFIEMKDNHHWTWTPSYSMDYQCM